MAKWVVDIGATSSFNRGVMEMLSYIIWNVRPEVFSFSALPRWYGLMWALGLFLAYQLMQHIYKKEAKCDVKFNALIPYIVIGALVGARLGHILFYDPQYYWENPVEILPISLKEGFEFTGFAGLASHGGVTGVLIGMILYCRKYNIKFLWLADRLVTVGILCGGFIRLGNLFNSEIIGIPSNLPWAFVFGRIDNVPRHPTQIYEALFYFLTFAALWVVYDRFSSRISNGIIFSSFLVLLFMFRFFVEFLKEDQEVLNYGLGINAGQILSLPFILLGLSLFFFVNYRSTLKTKL